MSGLLVPQGVSNGEYDYWKERETGENPRYVLGLGCAAGEKVTRSWQHYAEERRRAWGRDSR